MLLTGEQEIIRQNFPSIVADCESIVYVLYKDICSISTPLYNQAFLEYKYRHVKILFICKLGFYY
jgi:hypothetical protein